MADFNSSLPVRTENAGDVIAKIADATTPSQQLAIDASGRIIVKIEDGSGNALTSQANGSQRALDVGINVAGVQIDPRSIRTLTSSDTVTVVQTTGSNLHVSADNFPTTVDTNYGTVGASTIRTAAQIGNATGSADFNAGATGAQTLRTQANQGAPNTAGNAWPISVTSGGTLNGPTNPLFVSLSDTAGTSIDNYNTSASLAAGGTSNHDYTVTAAKTFYTNQFWASASGKLKIEVQYETASGSGIFNSFWVGFNSTSDPNILIPVPTRKTQVAGARIRIIRTNEDKASMDVYSTTSGTEQ